MSRFKKGVDKIIKTEEQIAVEQAANLLTKQEAEKEHIEILNEIEAFTKLNANWDGYGAIPMCEEVFENTKPILKVLEIEPNEFYPNAHGTLSLEYTKRNNFLSLEIGIDRFSYYVNNNNNVIYKDLKEFTDDNLTEMKYLLNEI